MAAWREEERAHQGALLAATEDVGAEVRALRHTVEPPPPEHREIRHPRVPWQGIPGLALAMRFCRDLDGEVAGLAQLLKRVPTSYVSRVCVLESAHELWAVSCVCGEVVFVGLELTPCACGRWLVGDDLAVYAIRLPDQEREAA